MPRDDRDRYEDDDDYDDRPRRRGGVSGGNTVLIVLGVLGLIGVLGCGGIIVVIVMGAREAAKDFREGLKEAVEKAAQAAPEVGPPALRTTVAEISQGYTNEKVGDKKYQGKVVRVDGVVELVTQIDFETSVRLTTAGADPTAPRVIADFHFNHKAAAVGLKPGQTVSVVGECTGRSEDDDEPDEDNPQPNRVPAKYVVRLDRCRLATPADDTKSADAKPAETKPAGTGKRESAPAPKKAPPGEENP